MIVKRVQVTIALAPNALYPFCVMMQDTEGKYGQPILVRSVRDGTLVANGMIHGFLAARVDCPANPEYDIRLSKD